MQAIIKLKEGSGKALLCDKATPENIQDLIKIITLCTVIDLDYNGKVDTTERTPPTIAFIADDSIPPEIEQLNEENAKLKKSNSDLWMTNYKLTQELDKLKNPQPAPVVGVDNLN